MELRRCLGINATFNNGFQLLYQREDGGYQWERRDWSGRIVEVRLERQTASDDTNNTSVRSKDGAAAMPLLCHHTG